MFGKHLFQLARRQAVARDIDDVVGARHDVEIAVLVLVAGITGLVIAGEGRQIFLDKGVVRAPDAGKAGWRQGQFHPDGAELAGGLGRAVFTKDIDFVPRHRHGWRAELHRQGLDSHRVGTDRPAGLCLPPVVDHRNTQLVLRPQDGVGVGALAGKEQMLQARRVVLCEERGVRIGPLDRAERCRRGEQDLHPVLGDDPPEHAGVGRSDGLAFKQHRRATGDQRRIDDVGMADHPADVRCGPVNLAGMGVIDVRHGPLQRHRMAAIVADHALGLAGGARGVEYVERVGRLHRHRGQWLDPFMGGMPFQVTALDQISLQRLALVDHTVIRLVRGQLDGLVQKRLVGHDPVRLVPAGRADDGFRGGIVDPLCQLGRGKAAEHHRMHGAKARASEHRHDCLGNHRHVDDDPVARRDTQLLQHAGKARRGILQLGIGHGRRVAGDRRVIDDRLLLAAPGRDMTVDGIVAGVHLAIGKPAMKRGLRGIQSLGRRLVPVDGLGSLHPECLDIRLRGRVKIPVICHDT